MTETAQSKTMTEKVDLYNSAYGNYGAEVYRQIRVETYGEDLGQTSWVTTEESSEIPRRLGITAASKVLEIGSGSGRYALQVASATGCRILGVDINEPGIQNANSLAALQKLAERAQFEKCDASQPLEARSADTRTRTAKIVIDDRHIRPAESTSTVGKAILTPSALMIVGKLVDGGLPNVDEGATRQMVRRDLHRFPPPQR